jgi:hypothetical protein
MLCRSQQCVEAKTDLNLREQLHGWGLCGRWWLKPTTVVESNSELDLKAEDQRGGVYQGGAEAKLAVTAAVLRLGKTVGSGR